VLESSDVDELKSAFGNAAQLLAKTVQTVQNRFGQDAIRQHYWYLRSLESLSVPLRFYEAEAGRFWGMKTFSHVRAGCEHFLRACEASDQLLKRELSKVYEVCSLVEERMKSAGPPLWDALCNLCVDEPNSDEARLIVFSGQSRKHLFLLALLAYYNVTENDLREVKTWAVTLEEFRYLIRDGNVSNETCANGLSRVRGVSNWRPLLVGLPSTNMNSKLLPVFLQPNIDFVIYPHQLGLLRRRIDDWAQALTLDVNNLVGVLRRCGGSLVEDALEVDSTIKPRVKPSQPVTLSAGTARRRALTNIESLWQAEALSDEVSSLLEVEDQHLDGEPQFHESRQPAENEDSNTWCDEAVELRFESGTAITFPSDEFINVIVAGDSGLEIDERAVRSLRKGDRVVLIHGQKRQSFYELIISRLHQHPSLLLHLSLIRRWQTDFISSFNRWRLHEGRTLEQFLNLMRERGSELTSTATIQSWLRGQTLCPQDAEDLRRISEVLGLEFIRQNYIRVGRAASRLRGLHRGMANKLNRWLQQQAIGIDSGNDDELIDQDLGLTFGDIRSSLSIEMVSDKSIIEGPVLRGSLGRLEV
jgi:transcriptional regulator with XRE-family HTH domain